MCNLGILWKATQMPIRDNQQGKIKNRARTCRERLVKKEG